MTVNKERAYWRTNPEWYYWDNGVIKLTNKATERAKKSFELYRTPKRKNS